ncbi:hypothetical protein [Massilia suwonensis]|uniref:RiboL-PSP-HEPN domain-containing protein n=1 Tax=Massilia suwonensis TaxID=648895 RepID=A0ABW0MU47_9BURK
MLVNVTFDCSCGGFVDENFGIELWYVAASTANRDDYHQAHCDGCGKDYEVHISRRDGELNVDVDGAFNLGWDTVEGDDIEQLDSAIRYLEQQLDESERELAWVIRSTKQLDTFQTVMTDVVALLNAEVRIPNMSTLYNMMHAQVVTGVEAYLSGVFIHKVVNSNDLMRKLVETDPELAKRQFSLKEIFSRWEGLQLEVARYLQDLIFHDLKKIKPMYKDVLGIDLGDIPWLFKAVLLRHDCVHRNGVDKNGKPTGIDKSSIDALIRSCVGLIARIDEEVAATPTLFDAPG